MSIRFFVLIAFVGLQISLFGQGRPIPTDPVKWTFSAKNVFEGEYDLYMVASIDKSWCIYSQFMKGDDGPVPTSFSFTPEDGFQPIGKTTEDGHRKEIDDPIFNMKVVKFEDNATFKQRVRVGKNQKFAKGFVTFMTCDGSVCLPPKDVPFAIELKK